MKKKFSQGIDAILSNTSKRNKASNKSKNVVRTTFLIDKELIEKLKALAYWERQTITTIITQALQQFLESKNTDYLKEALENFQKNLPIES